MSRPALIEVLSAAMVLFAGQACPGKPYDGLSRLFAEADAVVIVEIVSTDYSATVADRPMYAEAKVLKALTGIAGRCARLWRLTLLGPKK